MSSLIFCAAMLLLIHGYGEIIGGFVMNVDDLLSKGENKIKDHELLFLTGVVCEDTDVSRFRIYPIPNNHRRYMILERSSVVGGLYELTSNEMEDLGFLGEQVHKVTLRVGTPLDFVSIEKHKLGETMSSESFDQKKLEMAGKQNGGGRRQGSNNPNLICAPTGGCASYPCCSSNLPEHPCLCDSCCVA